MVPKIELRYSRIHDDRYRNSSLIQKNLKKKKKTYPSMKKIESYTMAVKKVWKKEEKSILKEMSKITGLKWKEKKIICYVVGIGRSYSDPLTVRLFKNKSDFVDILTHELIHQIQMQNSSRIKNWFKYINKKYKTETGLTRGHILLHAIHWKILEKMFGKGRLKKNIKSLQKLKDYKRAWKIVEKEGADEIIKKFKKIIQ